MENKDNNNNKKAKKIIGERHQWQSKKAALHFISFLHFPHSDIPTFDFASWLRQAFAAEANFIFHFFVLNFIFCCPLRTGEITEDIYHKATLVPQLRGPRRPRHRSKLGGGADLLGKRSKTES